MELWSKKNMKNSKPKEENGIKNGNKKNKRFKWILLRQWTHYSPAIQNRQSLLRNRPSYNQFLQNKVSHDIFNPGTNSKKNILQMASPTGRAFWIYLWMQKRRRNVPEDLLRPEQAEKSIQSVSSRNHQSTRPFWWIIINSDFIGVTKWKN